MSAPTGERTQRADIDRLLRACIQCGLCLPVCATYLATGSEVHSPRGRLLLLAERLAAQDRARDAAPGGASRRDARPEVLEAFDLCLGCLACVTVCPSGIAGELIDAVKAEGHRRRSPATGWLVRLLASRRALRVLGAAAPAARAVLGAGPEANRAPRSPAAPASAWRRRLALRLGALPSSPQRDRDLVHLLDALVARAEPARPGATSAVTPPLAPPPAPPAGAPARAPVEPAPGAMGPAAATGQGGALLAFAGCANGGLLPHTSRRLRQLLAACGHEVVVPGGQGCCGALAAHAGRTGLAGRQRRRNAVAFAAASHRGGAFAPILVEAAGCGRELRAGGEGMAARVRDAVEFLAGLPLPPARPLPLRVAIHDPCHARHGQGIVAAPRLLLDRVPGLARLEPDETDVCCGSGGPYALFHPELSAAMARRKAERLAETGADLIVTSNPGCLGQIAGALAVVAPGLAILPLTDLLWYACLPVTSAGSGAG